MYFNFSLIGTLAMKNLVKTIFTTFVLPALTATPLMAISTTALAQAVEKTVTAVPNGWRLQNYVPDTVTLWHTTSECTNGNLSLPATATKADRDRLFAVVMAGKAASKPVFVYYTVNGTSCTINSFGMIES
jgi:hypothetical protein